MSSIKSLATDTVGFVALLGLVLAALLPIYVGAAITAVAFPDSLDDAAAWSTWGYVTLAAVLWLPLTGVAMMLPSALARGAGLDRDHMALQVVSAFASWLVLGWLLDALVFATFSTALLAAVIASGGYLLARPWVERATPD